MAKVSYSSVFKCILAIVSYLIANIYVLWHLDRFVGDYFNPNFLLIFYWGLSLITLMMFFVGTKKHGSARQFIKFIGRRFLEVLIYLSITYLIVDVLYLVSDALALDKRNLVEYVGGITFFVIVGVMMFGQLNISKIILNKYSLRQNQ